MRNITDNAVLEAEHRQKQYDSIAEVYDVLEHHNYSGDTPITNKLLQARFEARGVKSVLDMTCGTGTQTIALHKAGYRVLGTDLSEGMLKVARRKSQGTGIEYRQADMREVSVGTFDAIITMFNSIGHLTYDDFELASRNAFHHLNAGGMYVFDIFDTDVIRNVEEHEFIDAIASRQKTKYVRFSRCRFNPDNEHVEVRQRTYVQERYAPPQVIEEDYSLQTYRKPHLQRILSKIGFRDITITGDGLLDEFGMPGLCHLAIAYKS